MEQRSAAVLIPERHEVHVPNATRWKSVWKQRTVLATLISLDTLLAVIVWGAASMFQGIWGQGALLEMSAAAMAPVVAIWLGMRAILGLYPGYGMSSVEQLRRHTYAVFAALAVLAVLALSFQVGESLSRLLLVLVFLGLLVFAPLVHYGAKWCLKETGIWGKPVVVLSYKATGTDIVGALKADWDLGYDPVAVVDFRLDMLEGSLESEEHQQALSEVVDLSRRHGIDTAIFAMPYIRREQLAKLVKLASLSFRHVLVIPNLNGITNSAVMARNLAGTFAVEIKHNLLNPWALRIKRTMDLCATVIGGALLLPFLLLLTLLVYLESGGPIFFEDRRMGRDGKLFSCIKFRTMVPDAESLLQRVLEDDEELRREYFKYHKLRDDPRVTRIGRFLRKTSLDELPQLWNVLRGEMSLIGPRPYLPRESEEIGVTQGEILRVPPGMSGPWQVSGRSRSSFEDRVRMDDQYVHDWSVWLDIVLLARTVKTVALDRGAY